MTSIIKSLLITIIPEPGTIEFILYLLIPVLFIYLWVSSKRFVTSVVSMLIILSVMTPIAFTWILGIRGLQLIYFVWGVALISLLIHRPKKRKPTRLGKFFAWPVALFLVMQLVAWCMTFLGGPDHTYYLAGFTTSQLVFGYLLSPFQIVVSGWMLMVAAEKPEDRTVIERAVLISALILGGLIACFYLKLGSLSGSDVKLMSGRLGVGELMGVKSNAVSGMCLYLYIASLRLKNHGTKWLPVLAIGASLMGILFTLSRMAWVSVVLVTALMFPRMKTSLKVVLVVCAIGMYFQFHTIIKNRVFYGLYVKLASEEERYDQVSAGRLTLWGDAWKAIKENPVFGTGIPSAIKTSWGAGYANHPHNAYLGVLLNMGFIGLIGFGVCYRYLFVIGWRSGGPLAFCVIGLLFMGVFGLEFHVHKHNYMIWFLYGLSLRNNLQEEKEPGSNRLAASSVHIGSQAARNGRSLCTS